MVGSDNEKRGNVDTHMHGKDTEECHVKTPVMEPKPRNTRGPQQLGDPRSPLLAFSGRASP